MPIAQTKRGFTIVELLIVIVVIGILAAITIVAYNGIQQRAKNASRTSSAQQASKLIRAYYAEKGNYPFDGTTCVTDTCTDYAGTAEAASRTILLANLKTIGNPPTKSAAAGKYYGIWYNTRAAGASYDGDSSKPVILMMYWLDGQSQNCGLDNIAIQGTGEAWQRSPNRWSYNDSAENATACWVSV